MATSNEFPIPSTVINFSCMGVPGIEAVTRVKMVKEKNKEKSEKVKYDAATTVRCPKCNEEVQVGTVGPAGIIQHQGKKSCQKARQAKKDKGKLWTLFQVGVKRVQALLPGTALTRSDKLPSRATQAQQPQTEIQRSGCELGRKLIAELKRAAKRMGQKVPIATESDKILAFKLARAEAECTGIANDEIWEVVNPALDRLLGFRRLMGGVESIGCFTIALFGRFWADFDLAFHSAFHSPKSSF
ncbi:hypothetical protein B0H34DRAFT_676656 [Crassisporium funariophilum]|nr:hypothetical protein B0H34DRAFT_676656 [Crassisporium funariophilum]